MRGCGQRSQLKVQRQLWEILKEDIEGRINKIEKGKSLLDGFILSDNLVMYVYLRVDDSD